MAHARWLMALLFSLAWLGESRAQIVIYNPYGYDSVIVGRGLGFSYHRHRLKYWGYYGAAAPYGVSVKDVSVVFQPPPIIVNSRPRGREPDEYDTRGIDLDETDPVTMKPRPREPARERLPEKPEAPPKQRPRPPKVPEPPAEEDANLIDRGKKAFADREYGLAAQHFRLATREDPRAALPHFLLAQAQFAVAKYRDAVESIHAGMDLKRDWPRTKFPPRQLYQGNENDFLGHLKRLEDVLDTRPDDPALLFLLAYELWFDGKPGKARPLFEKAKRFAADPEYINRFLE